MANNNNIETNNSNDCMEIADKALETVTGGSTEMEDKLIKYHKHLESLKEKGLLTNTSKEFQMLLELDKPTTKKTEGTITDLKDSCIVHSGKVPSQDEINSFLDTLL